MSAFLQEFKSVEDIEREFDAKVPPDAEILIAWRGYGFYCGSAFVLYRLDGTLYEVNASHCSCYGIEGQWDPEEPQSRLCVCETYRAAMKDQKKPRSRFNRFWRQ